MDMSLYKACEENDVGFMEFALEGGMMLDLIDSLLLTACSSGSYDVVELLIENGANVNYFRGYSLEISSCRGFVDIVRLLLTNGAICNNAHNKSLVCARTQAKSVSIANLLVEYGARQTFKDKIWRFCKNCRRIFKKV